VYVDRPPPPVSLVASPPTAPLPPTVAGADLSRDAIAAGGVDSAIAGGAGGMPGGGIPGGGMPMICLPPQGPPPPNTAAGTAHSAHSTQPALPPHRATPRVEDNTPADAPAPLMPGGGLSGDVFSGGVLADGGTDAVAVRGRAGGMPSGHMPGGGLSGGVFSGDVFSGDGTDVVAVRGRSVAPAAAPFAEQRGVVRTNCIDCLDRTNVAQFCIG